MSNQQERAAGVAGRAGLVARGAVYCVLAIAAIQVATGPQDRELDRQGALRLLARQRFGPALLVVLVVGFMAYAAWRTYAAATTDDGWTKRLLHGARAVLYLSFAWTTVKLLLGRNAGASSDSQAKSWSARVMAHTGGRPLAVVVGIGLLVGGAVLCWRGAHQTFKDKLETGRMRGWQRTWLPRLGTAGHSARGVVLGLIGLFLVRAALTFDPHKAVGVDGALHELAGQPYGTFGLVLLAAGLACYGLFSFVEARWRDVLDA
jgi:hypothetical protein